MNVTLFVTYVLRPVVERGVLGLGLGGGMNRAGSESLVASLHGAWVPT